MTGVTLGYADPPYLGCCNLYGHHHQEPYGCWDDLNTHRQLIGHLSATFDGWALSMSAPSLRQIVQLHDTARIAAWVKPFAAFRRHVRVAYTWEPVMFVPARESSATGAHPCRDHLAEGITMRRGFTGAKPDRFNRWVLDMLGYVPGDTVVDLFPGSRTMERTLSQGRLL